MTTYNGDNGDNNLVGTGADDIFNPGLGHDKVDGQGGVDTLNVDYSGVSPATGLYWSSIQAVGWSFLGSIYGGDYDASVDFQSIERINLKLDAGDDTINVAAGPMTAGASLSIDGGGGYNTLGLDLSTLPDSTFTADANGVATTSWIGTYTNFQNYDLTFGNGDNTVTIATGDALINIFGNGHNVVYTGAGFSGVNLGGGANIVTGGSGNDEISSTGGVDTIDGGGGYNEWNGDYSQSTAALVFTSNGNMPGIASLSNGTTLKNIDGIYIATGSGDDTFDLTHPLGGYTLDGGSGSNTLTLDQSGQTTHGITQLFEESGSFSGQIAANYGAQSVIELMNMTHLDLTLGDGDDSVSLATLAPAQLAAGVTVQIDGGLGNNSVTIDSRAFGDTDFTVASDGTLTTTLPLTLTHFQSFDLSLGGGTNHVTLGAGDDTVIGGAGNDTLTGGDGADTLYGMGGINVLHGGDGEDSIYSDLGSGVDTVDGGAGSDAWYGSGATTGVTLHFDGETGAGTVSNGTTLTNIEAVNFTGGTGDDTVVIDDPMVNMSLSGGGGDDTLVVDESNQTSDLYQNGIFSAPRGDGTFGTEAQIAGSSGGIDAKDFNHFDITMTQGNDTVGMDETLLDNGVTILLDGGAGKDTLSLFLDRPTTFVATDGLVTGDLGGTFLDFENYHIDLAGDGAANHITLGSGDDMILGQRSTGDNVLDLGGGNNFVSAGSGNDHIITGSGDDAINGGLGADVMQGGAGNDTYVVDNIGDQVIENPGGGSDTVISSISWTLGANVENLQLIGTAAIDSTGSALDNQLTGNSGANILDGGAGADRMAGGGGNDTYVVDNVGDKVVESAGGGIDTVRSSISYALGANVENLTLTGIGNNGGTGNALDNILTGNGANNSLNGRAGNDRIDGGAGFDTLTGGAGADSFVFSTALGVHNIDRITDFTSGQDKVLLWSAIFAGLPTGVLADSAFKDLSHGAEDASDHILFDPTTGALSYDPDGAGGVQAIQFATLDNHAALHASDLVLI